MVRTFAELTPRTSFLLPPLALRRQAPLESFRARNWPMRKPKLGEPQIVPTHNSSFKGIVGGHSFLVALILVAGDTLKAPYAFCLPKCTPQLFLFAMIDSNTGSFAFVPTEALNETKESTLGTYGLALESPLPLTLAALVADEERSLPMFFVNEVAAKRSNIDSGWYVLAEPGKKFYL